MSTKKNDEATTALATTASTTVAPSNRLAARYDDEDNFQELATEFNFWSPMLVTKDEAGMVLTQELCTLRGVPLVHRVRPPRADDTMVRKDANGRPIPQHYMVVCLTAPCRVKTHEKTIKEAKPGEMVWMDMRSSMTVLEDFLPQRPKLANGNVDMESKPEMVFEVIIRPLAQRDIGGGKKVWNFSIKKKAHRLNANTLPTTTNLLPPATPEALPTDDDGPAAALPF